MSVHLIFIKGPTPTTTPTQEMTGKFTDFPLPQSPLYPGFITKGPDGNLWYTEVGNNQTGKIGSITLIGEISEFPVPTFEGSLLSITAGPDGNHWYTETGSNNGPGKIERITPSGNISEFMLPHYILSISQLDQMVPSGIRKVISMARARLNALLQWERSAIFRYQYPVTVPLGSRLDQMANYGLPNLNLVL